MTDLPQTTVPCPFCGMVHAITYRSKDTVPTPWYCVLCLYCGVTGPRRWTPEDAVVMWEKRTVVVEA